MPKISAPELHWPVMSPKQIIKRRVEKDVIVTFFEAQACHLPVVTEETKQISHNNLSLG
jgi:hypothetical protein